MLQCSCRLILGDNFYSSHMVRVQLLPLGGNTGVGVFAASVNTRDKGLKIEGDRQLSAGIAIALVLANKFFI